MLRKYLKLPEKFLNKTVSIVLSMYLVFSPLLTLGASNVIALDEFVDIPAVVEVENTSETVETPTPIETPTPVETPEVVETPAPVETPEVIEEEYEEEEPTAVEEETEVVVLADSDGNMSAEIVETKKCMSNSLNACVISDKEDYAPTEVVVLDGHGYQPNTQYLLVIYSNDNPPVRYESTIVSDDNGSFNYSYQLDGVYRPNYFVEVRSIESDELVADHTFTDSDTGFTFANKTISSNGVGDPNNGWVSDNNRASFNNNNDYAEYGFPELGIPSLAVIDGISIRVEASRTSGSGHNRALRVSIWNESENEYTSEETVTLSSSDVVYTLGGPTSKWGEVWRSSDFSDSDFKVRVRGGGTGNGDARLDAIEVKIYYTEVEITANPSLPQACGLDIALILDNSTSINSTELSQMKSAMTSFTSAFSGTPTHFSVSRFATTATVIQAFTSDLTLVNAAINGVPQGGGWTNWEDGLLKGQSTLPHRSNPDLVIIASDGNPNRNGNGIEVDEDVAVASAVTVANSLKASGVRVVAIGIGVGGDLGLDNLKAISGPNVNTGINSDVITSNFDTLATTLAEYAAQLCGGTISVQKLVDGEPAQGWEFEIDGETYLTGADGYITSVDVDADTYSVVETQQSGYFLESASCTVNNQNVGQSIENGIGSITVGDLDVVTCVFNNSTAPFCGDGVVNQNSEQCDNGGSNGLSCEAGYGQSCNFCNSQCQIETVPGPYCGDGIVNGSEMCDGTAGVPNSNFTCSQSCNLELVERKVRICHSTGAHNNPYVPQEPDKSGDVNGHDGHNGPVWYTGITEDWGDIIPPFDYVGGSYPGKNWNDEGQAIWNNNCEPVNNFATLTIKKETNPNSSTRFDFTTNFSNSFKLRNGEDREFGEMVPGEYTVSELSKSGWYLAGVTCDIDEQSYSLDGGTLTVDLSHNDDVTCTFENEKLGKVEGFKYNDRDGNEKRSWNEQGLGYWKIFIDEDGDKEYDEGEEFRLTTNLPLIRGYYKFDNLLPGNYSVCEVMQDGWYNSTHICQEVVVNPGETTDLDFGNHQSLKIETYKVVCKAEEYLPNWSHSGVNINSNTAQNWVNNSDGNCELVQDWKFQYGPYNPGFTGQTDTSELGGEWTTFNSGTTLEITDFSGMNGRIEIREVFPSNDYVGFSNTSNNYSAEIYCSKDVKNYDNWEWITNYKYGETYHCVAFNALKTGNLKVMKDVLNPDGEEVTDTTTKFTIRVEGVGEVELTDEEFHTFTNLPVGTYTVTEDENGNYTFDSFSADNDTEAVGAQVEVVENETTELTVFNKQNKGQIVVYKDVVDSNGDDAYSNDLFEVVLSGEEYEETGMEISDSEVDPKVATYADLNPGTYYLTELPADGYTFNGCYRLQNVQEDRFTYLEDSSEVELASGETLEYVCENQEILPELILTKSNNSTQPQLAGTTVTYTLTVKAPVRESDSEEVVLANGNTPYVLNDVKLTDLTPDGFEYVSGTWTAVKNGSEDLKASNDVLEPTYASPGTWSLGTMVEGDEIVLTYVAIISQDQNPGLYKDLAWTQGTSLTGSRVLGVAIEEGGVFAGTDVAVVEDIEEGNAQVLGVSLPNTGANWVWVALGLLSLLLGAFLIFSGRKSNVGKLILASAVVLFGVVTLINPSESYALGTHSVRLSEPKSPNGNVNSRISFAVLDVDSRAMEVTCYVKKPGEGLFSTFGTVMVPAGGNSGHCTTGATVLSTDGTYEFYVTVDASGDIATSSTVTMELDTQLPDPVQNYNKVGGVCQNTLNFTVANDGQSSKVQIFRSTQTTFVANSSTLIGTISVTPGQAVAYVDNPLPDCDQDYYYAVRAVDVANNSSDFVTDSLVTIEGGNQGQAGGGDVQGETDQDGENGGNGGEVKGDDDEDKDNGTKGDGDEKDDDKAKSTVWDWLKYVLLALVILGAGGVAYVYVSNRRADK